MLLPKRGSRGAFWAGFIKVVAPSCSSSRPLLHSARSLAQGRPSQVRSVLRTMAQARALAGQPALGWAASQAQALPGSCRHADARQWRNRVIECSSSNRQQRLLLGAAAGVATVAAIAVATKLRDSSTKPPQAKQSGGSRRPQGDAVPGAPAWPGTPRRAGSGGLPWQAPGLLQPWSWFQRSKEGSLDEEVRTAWRLSAAGGLQAAAAPRCRPLLPPAARRASGSERTWPHLNCTHAGAAH